MGFDILPYAMTSVVLLIGSLGLSAAIYYVARRAKKLHTEQEVEALSFEKELVSAARTPATPRSTAPAEKRIVAQPTMDMGANVSAPAQSATASEPPPESIGSLSHSVIDRLRIANCEVELGSTVKSNDGSIEGQIIHVDGKDQIIIIEEQIQSDHPALEPWLRLSKGIVMPGATAEDPIFINRFQDFLSDRIKL